MSILFFCLSTWFYLSGLVFIFYFFWNSSGIIIIIVIRQFFFFFFSLIWRCFFSFVDFSVIEIGGGDGGYFAHLNSDYVCVWWTGLPFFFLFSHQKNKKFSSKHHTTKIITICLFTFIFIFKQKNISSICWYCGQPIERPEFVAK